MKKLKIILVSNPLTTITPTSTFTLTGNITFKNYLHESLPSEWIAEYNTIMQNMIELAPTSVVPWFEEELNIFAWLDDIDKPFTVSVQDWDGTEKSVTVEGQCLCGYGDKRWMSLEMFSPEFEDEFPNSFSHLKGLSQKMEFRNVMFDYLEKALAKSKR